VSYEPVLNLVVLATSAREGTCYSGYTWIDARDWFAQAHHGLRDKCQHLAGRELTVVRTNKVRLLVNRF